MSKLRRHEIDRITIRYVRLESINRRARGDYYPSCRGNRRKECRLYPAWNVRYEYKSMTVRGGGQSMYWCDVCLPARYQTVADSMVRGNEDHRILKDNKAMVAVAGPQSGVTGSSIVYIPWHSLL